MRGNSSPRGWLIGLVAAAVIIVLLIGRKGFAILVPVIIFILIAILALFVLVIGGTIYAIRSGCRSRSKSTVNLNKEDALIIEEAEKGLSEILRSIKGISDRELNFKAMKAYSSAKKTVDQIRKQPEEIRRAVQFFNYYIPAFKTIVLKYLVLQESGENTEEYRRNLSSHFDTLYEAFCRHYSALFESTKLDLTVETKALEAALKRDGFA